MSLEKSEIINYLNNKIKKQPLSFDQDDINFIRQVIYHYSGKLISMENIISSINSYGNMTLNYYDNMITKLINDFDIQTKTVKKLSNDPSISMVLTGNPFQNVEVDIISEYF